MLTEYTDIKRHEGAASSMIPFSVIPIVAMFQCYSVFEHILIKYMGLIECFQAAVFS